MRPFHHALNVLGRVSLAGMFQYRGEILLWALWGVVYPAVAIAMWSAAAIGSGTPGDIQGFGPRDFAAYFLMTMIVGHFCTAWDVYEMGHLVQSGAMSPKLLRPILPLWESLTDNLAYKLLTFVVLAPIWAIVAWITQPAFATSGLHWTIGLISLVLASALNFVWGYNLAMVAFWVTRTEALGEVWFGGSMFFGGRLAPLSLLPGLLQGIAWLLPFKWIIWFPSAVLMGKTTTTEMISGLGMQSFWLAAGLVVFRFGWRRSVRHYAAVGA